MKLQVTASSSPRAAAARRTRRSSSCYARRGRPGDAGRALERSRGHLVVAPDPDDLLDQVGRAFDVAPPGRHRRPRLPLTSKPRLSRISLWRSSGTSMPPSALVGRSRRRRSRFSIGGCPGAHRRRRLAAADVEDQPGQDRQPVIEERRIDPALEAAARVAGQAERLPGARDPLGREISAFRASRRSSRRRRPNPRRP